MALRVPKAQSSNLFKSGSKHLSGLEESVLRNVEACTDLAKITRTSFGPNGMNKMVINHLEKLFVTSDAATIIKELEVQHPAAKMLVLNSRMQEQEVGDGTNFVLMFAGALLEKSQSLIQMGLHPSEIIQGYIKAGRTVEAMLPSLVCENVKDVRDAEEMKRALRPVLMAKQLGNEDMLTRVCVDAAQMVLPSDVSKFNPDAIRIVKILGSGVEQSRVLAGMVFNRDTEGAVKAVENAKIAIFNTPLDFAQTETKGTVLLKNADDLLAFSEGEEKIINKQIADIAATGVNMIVAGGKVGALTQHFLDKHGIMVVRLLSKFDLRRLCKSVGATPLPRVGPPTAEECGFCKSVKITDIGGSRVCVFDQGEDGTSRVATIIVRGSTRNSMEDIERAVDDGVSVFKGYCDDSRMVAGAGAAEMEIAHRLNKEADTIPGLEQYAMRKYAEALEIVPRALAENVGQRAAEVVALLNTKHQNGEHHFGIDINSEYAAVTNAKEAGILDALNTKIWSFRLATEAAATVLRVDQIIMSKPAGGPKLPGGGPNRDP